MDTLYPITYTIITWLQILSPTLDVPMEILTFMGTFEFYMLFIPLLYWLVDPGLGLRILYLLIAVDSFGMYFKHLFHQPRPYWVREFTTAAQETSYGIPSTHASDSLAVWGYIAYRVRKNWMWVLSTVLVLLIGISRMYLAVHFLHDVLFGWLLGFVVLFLFIRTESRVLEWWNKNSISIQITYGFVLSVVLILIGLLVVSIISTTPDRQLWADLASEARAKSSYFTLGGALFGTIAGTVLMIQYARFKVQGSWMQKIARYGLGVVVVLAVYLGLDALFALIAPDQSILGYLLRYIRYGAVTFWAIFGAPWVFIKLKLASTE
jgi:membrane-associated phospholipid phosphatase